jgi:DNA-binding response OmpR family regulator
VLVVGSDETIRMFAVEALRASGRAVDEAATASEALGRARAAGGRYDAVLVDLPAVESLVAELRTMHANLPILISANEHAGTMRERFAEDRWVAVIHKPYNAAKLQAVLDELRARSSADFSGSSFDLRARRS